MFKIFVLVKILFSSFAKAHNIIRKMEGKEYKENQSNFLIKKKKRKPCFKT